MEAAGISSSAFWLGGPAANQAQWFVWEKKGRRDHPSHHYYLIGPLLDASTLHARTNTSWAQGPSRDRVAGSREKVGTGEGCVRGQGRGGTGVRTPRWEGWTDGSGCCRLLVPGVTFSRTHLSPSGL